jgi:hypothetical protein
MQEFFSKAAATSPLSKTPLVEKTAVKNADEAGQFAVPPFGIFRSQ